MPAPAGGIVFPDERRRDKKLEPIITPPVLPVLEHLERDPSTLLPSERRAPQPVKPRFGFGGGFNVAPSNGGLTASISSSANGAGASQAASQSFSFGFNEGFSASHSASQASSFNSFGRSVTFVCCGPVSDTVDRSTTSVFLGIIIIIIIMTLQDWHALNHT